MEFLEITLGTVGIMFALMIWSYLYKVTRIYLFAERTFIAVAVAHNLLLGLSFIQTHSVTPLIEGEVLMLVPIVLTIILLSRLYKKWSWISRWSLAILLGSGLGLNIRATAGLVGYYLGGSIEPVVGVDTIISIIGLICVSSYFIYTRRQKGYFGYITKIGRYYLMLLFGMFGGTEIFTRTSFLAERLHFILEFLGLV